MNLEDRVIKLEDEVFKDKVLTIKEAEEKCYEVFSYPNGDYEYEDNNNIQHLLRNDKELCHGIYVFSYPNGDYSYQDNNYIEHLIRDGKELFKGKSVFSYPNGDYHYLDNNYIEHRCRIINNEVWEMKSWLNE